jgi:hypothetical protein
MKKIQPYLLIFFIACILDGCITKEKTMSALPCSVEENSNSQYIRRVGHGASANLQMARKESLIDAKIKILSHLLNTPLLMDLVVFLQTDILPFEKECEKVFFNENQYHVYTRLACQIPDEKRLVYYRERFHKYAEEKQRQMLDINEEEILIYDEEAFRKALEKKLYEDEQKNKNVEDPLNIQPDIYQKETEDNNVSPKKTDNNEEEILDLRFDEKAYREAYIRALEKKLYEDEQKNKNVEDSLNIQPDTHSNKTEDNNISPKKMDNQ